MYLGKNIVIEKGVLKKYRVIEKTVVQVPEGVTEMGYAAFEARSLGYTNHLAIYAPAGSYAEKYTRGASRNTCPCGAARFAQKGMQKNTRSPSWRSKRRD